MPHSKPDSTTKNTASSSYDFVMHFRTKDESLTELPANESHSGDDNCGDENPESSRKEEPEQFAEGYLREGHEATGSQPSEYKKMLKNLNEFTEKITRTVEEKFSGKKSDRSSSRTRILNSKDNSSVSDSEDNSESSRISDHKSTMDDSPRKSNEVVEVGNLEGELRRRKKNWSPDFFRLLREQEAIPVEEEIEIQTAIEAHEGITAEESEDEEESFSDAVEHPSVAADDSGVISHQNGNLFRLLRFSRDPTYRNYQISAAVIFLSVLILSLPAFVTGFLSCLLLVIMYLLVTEYLNSKYKPHPFLPKTQFAIPNYEQLSPLKVPAAEEESGVWFNEYTQLYDPDFYSVTQTIPVYLELRSHELIVSHPKVKVEKRAKCGEKKYKLEFDSRRVYDLRNCQVSLRPEGIVRRRFFSKKYPIFIKLEPDSLVKAVRIKDSSLEEEDVAVENFFKAIETVQSQLQYGKDYLNLFARCNRQKEEWYRKLKAASKIRQSNGGGASSGASTPFENLGFDTEMAEYEEYWQYMSRFVGDIENLTTSEKDETLLNSEMGARWLNALINRILFDVFRTPYWLDKIKARVQRKLNTLRLPYYIEAIEVIELDIGKVGPKFHRISPPLLDDRGLWVDMDLTFDGSLRMILQTQLNVTKLRKGLEEDSEKLPDEKAELGPSINGGDDDDTDSSESDDDDDEEDTDHTAAELSEEQHESLVETRSRTKKSQKKIFRVVESVAKSKYFKSIAETNYGQKFIANVSATKLRLVLEVKSCIGTLTFNFPPPPNDRFWYCFRDIPKLWMSAQPELGQRAIRLSPIKHFVERKILDEIKKVVVYPNMDDILLPLPAGDLSVLSKILGVPNTLVNSS